MLRRTFLESAVSAGGAMALAAQGPPPGIRLGFDSYSIRAFQWRAMELLDYAASLKLDTIQLSSLEDYESRDPAYLRKVREHAERAGVSIDAGIGCICPSSASYRERQGDAARYIATGLEVAQAAGAKIMRCFMGSSADRHGALPIEAHMENTVKVLRSVRQQALDTGVKIAVENHAGDMQAREVKWIIEEAGRDFVASCLDTGNPLWAMEDPFVTLETLAPYVVTTHIRDSAVFEVPRGAAWQWVSSRGVRAFRSAREDGKALSGPDDHRRHRQAVPCTRGSPEGAAEDRSRAQYRVRQESPGPGCSLENGSGLRRKRSRVNTRSSA